MVGDELTDIGNVDFFVLAVTVHEARKKESKVSPNSLN